MSSSQSEIVISVDVNEKAASYKITSSSSRPGFALGTITVVRRYSDFSWLRRKLSREFPGVIVPPLPEKQPLWSGRRGLETFLQRIASHNEIGNSQFYVTFLQADEGAMARAKGDAKAAKPALASKAMAWFDVTVNNIANGKAEIEKSAAETKIEEISQYILALEKQMVSVTKHSEGLVKRSRELSSAMFEFGQSITWLGQSEGDVIGTALTQMGSSVDSLSVAASSHAEQECIKLLEPLEEYARMLTSIKYTMQQRTDKKTAYVNAMGDLEGKQNAYKKLLGVPGKESQAAQKESAVQAAQEATDAAKGEFKKVSEQFLAEFETLKAQKTSTCDMMEFRLSFDSSQIEFNRKSEEAWRDLLPKMQAIALSEPPSRGGGGYTDFASVSHQSASSHYSSNPFSGVSDSYNKSNIQDHDEGMMGVSDLTRVDGIHPKLYLDQSLPLEEQMRQCIDFMESVTDPDLSAVQRVMKGFLAESVLRGMYSREFSSLTDMFLYLKPALNHYVRDKVSAYIQRGEGHDLRFSKRESAKLEETASSRMEAPMISDGDRSDPLPMSGFHIGHTANEDVFFLDTLQLSEGDLEELKGLLPERLVSDFNSLTEDHHMLCVMMCEYARQSGKSKLEEVSQVHGVILLLNHILATLDSSFVVSKYPNEEALMLSTMTHYLKDSSRSSVMQEFVGFPDLLCALSPDSELSTLMVDAAKSHAEVRDAEKEANRLCTQDSMVILESRRRIAAVQSNQVQAKYLREEQPGTIEAKPLKLTNSGRISTSALRSGKSQFIAHLLARRRVVPTGPLMSLLTDGVHCYLNVLQSEKRDGRHVVLRTGRATTVESALTLMCLFVSVKAVDVEKKLKELIRKYSEGGMAKGTSSGPSHKPDDIDSPKSKSTTDRSEGGGGGGDNTDRRGGLRRQCVSTPRGGSAPMHELSVAALGVKFSPPETSGTTAQASSGTESAVQRLVGLPINDCSPEKILRYERVIAEVESDDTNSTMTDDSSTECSLNFEEWRREIETRKRLWEGMVRKVKALP